MLDQRHTIIRSTSRVILRLQLFVSMAVISVPGGPGHCGHDQIVFFRYSAGALAGPGGRPAGYQRFSENLTGARPGLAGIPYGTPTGCRKVLAIFAGGHRQGIGRAPAGPLRGPGKSILYSFLWRVPVGLRGGSSVG